LPRRVWRLDAPDSKAHGSNVSPRTHRSSEGIVESERQLQQHEEPCLNNPKGPGCQRTRARYADSSQTSKRHESGLGNVIVPHNSLHKRAPARRARKPEYR
jgi:hypothetical protein